MNDMQHYLVDEMVDEYRAGRLSRRELLRRVTLISGSAAFASTLAGTLGAESAAAEPLPQPDRQATPQTNPLDPDLRAGPVLVPGEGGALLGYLARPTDGSPRPAVLVIHENRGLTEHNMDVARRLAKVGYVALALDLLSPQGGAPSLLDNAQAMGALAQIPAEEHVRNLGAGVSYLAGLPTVQADRIGAMGFCWGGGMTWRLALANPAVRAAVPFYGPIPPMETVGGLQAAILAIYAGEDPNVNARIPEMEQAMRAAGKTLEIVIEPGARHAFFNDTGASYHAEAARDAWTRTLAWFGQYLAG